jgi:hypothetical protein
MMLPIGERHTVLLNAGIDWVTCSKKGSLLGSEFQALGDELVRGAKAADARTRLATWQGYAGLRGVNFFYGTHGMAAVVTLSGRHEPTLVQDFIRAADNVSRIDLQATVEVLPADPMLGPINYRQLESYDVNPGQKPMVTVIHNTRGGHTNAVGSRISDAYGRNYDKGVEGKLCEPGRVWRYEVEFKRGRAKTVAEQISLSRKVELDCARTVWRWWAHRGIRLLPVEPSGYPIDTRLPERPESDPLRWFETSVSQCVNDAIASHGLHAVLRALRLHNHVDREYNRKEKANDVIADHLSSDSGG